MTTTDRGPAAGASPAEAPAVLVERDGHLLILTINRPHAMNAINADVSRLLGEALEAAEADREIRAVVLTGAGQRSFCAGADLKAVARGESLSPPGQESWGFAGYVTHAISKPTIAAVNGFALGGGTEIALASDLVVAADHAVFGLPEVTRGIIAGAGGAFRLPRQLPLKVAMRLVLTGDPLPAAEALRWGLVNEVVPAADLLATARALGERIARNAPLAVQASKRIALGISDEGDLADEREDWRRNGEAAVALMRSRDAREGPLAFTEKREPRWEGR
jgi:crotonobetainyl-CoA hydratase